jgi:hypothetical protein
MWVTSETLGRSAPPIRRMVWHLVPPVGVPPAAMWTLVTPCCHSQNRVGSVAYRTPPRRCGSRLSGRLKLVTG